MAERVDQPTGHIHQVQPGRRGHLRMPVRFVTRRIVASWSDGEVAVREEWSDGEVTDRVMGDQERAAYLNTRGGSDA